MGGTLLSFSLLGVATRELTVTASLDEFQTLFLRSVIALMILTPFIIRQGRASIRTGNLKLHILRNSFSFAASYAWYFGIANLPLANVFAIEFTAPMWVVLLAVIFLGERFDFGRGVAVAFGVIGTLILLRPGLEEFSTVSLVVLASAFGFACSHTLTKGLTRYDSALTVVFWMSGMQALMGVGPAIAVWEPVTGMAWLWAIVMGIGSLTAHYCLARALSLADATIVVPLDFLRLPLIALVGFLVYSERIDIWVLIGAAVIFAGNYYSVRREHRAVVPVAGGAGGTGTVEVPPEDP